MILSNFKVFQPSGRILGIDWGACRTGIAVSDETHSFVFIRDSITTNRFDVNELIAKIIDVIHDEKITGVVVGLPVYADGTESDTTKNVKQFAQSLSNSIDIPIIFVEENFTSICAQEEIGRGSIKKIKQKLDSVSAKIILENAISIMKRS